MGCGGGSDAPPATDRILDAITLTIPEGFEEVPSQLVENRQITNQILYAGRQMIQAGDESTYALNLVVTTSQVSTGITFDQFAQVNNDKMQQFMIGYSRESYEVETFECETDGTTTEVSGVHTVFTIQDSYYQPPRSYQFHHYQFVLQGAGYIISLAGLPDEARTLRRTYSDVIDSLGCASG